MKRLPYRPDHRMRGAITVEFALLLVPMLVLVFGVAEFGRALYQYNTLVKSVRTAARYLSQFSPADPDYDKAKAYAGCLVRYGNLTCADLPLAPGLAPERGEAVVEIGHAIEAVEVEHVTVHLTFVEVSIKGYSFDFLLEPRMLLGGKASIQFGEIRASMRQS